MPPRFTGKRLLLVEDEADIRLGLEDIFRDEGFEVTTEETADGGDRRLAAEPYDILVCDIRTPGALTGVDLVQRARQRSAQLPLVIITGLPFVPVMPLTPLEIIVRKPFSLSLVLRAVEKLLYYANAAGPSSPS